MLLTDAQPDCVRWRADADADRPCLCSQYGPLCGRRCRGRRDASYAFVACSGATTASVISGQLAALSAQTTLVSITVGGNDVGFSSVMETCVLSSTSTCVTAIKAAEAKMTGQLPGELDGVLGDIAARAPGARVVLLGYPELYDLSKSICDSSSWLHSVDLLDISESYHPTASGQADAYEPTFAAAAG